MVKKVYIRLRELPPAVRGILDAESRDLALFFVTIPVVPQVFLDVIPHHPLHAEHVMVLSRERQVRVQLWERPHLRPLAELVVQGL